MRSLLFTIISFSSFLNLTFASRRISPRTAENSVPTLTTSSTVTIPTTSTKKDEGEAFLTIAKPSITPAPEVFIDGDGRVLGLDGELQEKWHLTTFTSCHTFDATFIYCGLHEPVLPGGDEIAGAVRPLDARGGILRAVMIVLGTLVGVDVFLR